MYFICRVVYLYASPRDRNILGLLAMFLKDLQCWEVYFVRTAIISVPDPASVLDVGKAPLAGECSEQSHLPPAIASAIFGSVVDGPGSLIPHIATVATSRPIHPAPRSGRCGACPVRRFRARTPGLNWKPGTGRCRECRECPG